MPRLLQRQELVKNVSHRQTVRYTREYAVILTHRKAAYSFTYISLIQFFCPSDYDPLPISPTACTPLSGNRFGPSFPTGTTATSTTWRKTFGLVGTLRETTGAVCDVTRDRSRWPNGWLFDRSMFNKRFDTRPVSGSCHLNQSTLLQIIEKKINK